MSRPLRIAVWYNLHSGGAKRALSNQLRCLTEAGHHVEAWRPPVPQDDFDPISRWATEHEVPLAVPAEPTSYIGRLVGHAWRQTGLIPAMRRHSETCADQMAAGGFDLLYATSCRFFYAPFIGRSVQLPKLLYLHEPNRFLYEALPRLPWPALTPEERTWKRVIRDRIDLPTNRIKAREELLNARAFGQILVNSHFSRESVLRAYGLDSSVCYLGIDTDKFKFSDMPRERFVLGVGGFIANKNPMLVIESIGRLAEPRPKVVWAANIVDPVYRGEVEAAAQRLGVELEILPSASDATVLDLMGRAAAMIYAPRLEPFGYVSLEANACGLPVIAVAEGGVRETMADGESGRVVESDPGAIANVLQQMLDDPAAAATLGRRASERVRELWSLDAADSRLLSAIDRFMADQSQKVR